MIEWMVRAGLASAALVLAAELGERSLAAAGRPRRWVWVMVMLLAAVLPLAALLLPPLFAPPAVSADALALVASALPGPEAAPAARAEWGRLVLALWLLATTALLGILAYALLRLRRARRGWQPAELDGTGVLLSRDLGPAVVGLLRPAVVVPAWVLSAPEEERRLVLLHEQEHVAAGDPWLLAGASLLTALLPWNPAVWWARRRLGAAVETDCDARVLRSGVQAALYGGLLLRTARRSRGAPVLQPALVESRTLLERRIRSMIRELPKNPVRAAVLLAVAIVPGLLACDLLSPGRSRETSPTAVAARPTGTAADTAGAVQRLQQRLSEGDMVPTDSVKFRVRATNGITAQTYRDGRVEQRRIAEGTGTMQAKVQPVVFLDGKPSSLEELEKLDPNRIAAMRVLKGPAAEEYLHASAEGKAVILVSTK